ncbi:tetratricopeptide repeat protein [Magnetospira thiophila]
MAEQKDPTQDMLFREVEEDLRAEQLAAFWKTWGNWIIGAAVALVVCVAGYQGWRNYDVSSRNAEGERFASALQLARTEQTDQAISALSQMGQDSRDGYAMMALYREASLLAKKGDRKAASLVFAKLADDSRFPALYRDMAMVLSALNDMDQGTTAELISRLEPIATDDNPWRHSARELIAALSYKAGDMDKAKQLYQRLSEEVGIPTGLRNRATEMLAVLDR